MWGQSLYQPPNCFAATPTNPPPLSFSLGRIILDSLCCHHQPRLYFPLQTFLLVKSLRKEPANREATRGLKWSEKKNNKKHWNNTDGPDEKKFKKE
jgi:hypothetical protein